jgi:hypothetical protein
MKYRHEMKYLMNDRDYVLIKLRLKTLMRTDVNAADSDGAYSVRSLYFDDYYNHAYNDKLAGAQNRSKYRIRIYNYSDKVIKLEKKVKANSYNHKLSASLTKGQFYAILQGDYEFLLKSSNNLLNIFYHECVSNYMRPRIVVDYDREPYTLEAGDVRITFDKNIRAGLEGFDIFDNRMPTVEVLDPGLLIFEVKFTEFLPNMIRRIMPSRAAEYLALSKFMMCCDKVSHKQITNT